MRLPYALFLSLLLGCSSKSQQSTDDSSSEGQPNEGKPNIVYILADDLGYGDLGCYGQQTIKTPNIDQLAADGMLFTNHYSGSSVCAPSRASLMTGKHTGNGYVRGNYETGPLGFGACLELRDEDVTVGEILKQAQYETAVVGKWGMGMDGTTGEPKKQGFDYSYGYLNQGHAHNQFPAYLFRNGEKIQIPENQNLQQGAFSNDLFTKEALQFISKERETPFFLYLAYTTPHAEMTIPESAQYEEYKKIVKDKPFKNKASKVDGNEWAYRSTDNPAAAYAAQVSHLDACVGKVVAELKAKGMDKNTIIIFSSDNGPHKEGGANPAYFNSSGGYKGMKRDLYEGGIHVPMIVKWPAKVKQGGKSDLISAFWDFLPTVADITGQTVDPAETNGISFLPTLLGQEQPQHEYLYWEFHENPTTDQAIRKGDYKAVRHDPKGEIELYNLTTDRKEEKNIAAENPEIVKEMQIIFDKARTPSEFWKLRSSK
ncbi:arylsulfatase A-like enzyme [Dyadobacter jejuensis]|uniref:Arylsulfatase A-like enzyme n=1 Tax=Dyadobacter jejuensis TaxID=1082580 RepID=A0A316AIT3_9BACT|nr:arylsulfatase [Dyadobacter jejuensis]PWJ57606.1 arylsulfatase A-like enzyme [Dyadobacter jejuensis]